MTTDVSRDISAAEFARVVGMGYARARALLKSGAVPTAYVENGRIYVAMSAIPRWQEARGQR